MLSSAENPTLKEMNPLLGGLVLTGSCAGGFLLGALWMLSIDLGMTSAIFSLVLFVCSLAALLVAARIYARISLSLAQNDQKHLQNALTQAKDMLDTSKRLREDNVLVQSLVQNLPYPVWLKDRFGRYLVYNQAFVQQWCGGIDAKGKTDAELLNPQLEQAFAAADRQTLETLTPQKLELHLEVTDQPARWVRIERYALLGEDKQILGVLGLSMDISNYKGGSHNPSPSADIDALTGFASQTGLNHFIDSTSGLTGQRWCLHIDIDHFKVLNDSLGQEFGDKLLVEMAERIRGLKQGSDFIARPSADEFVLFWQPEADDDSEKRLEDLHSQLSRPIPLKDNQYSVTTSIGAAKSPEHGETLKELRHNADIALFNAKKHGRNQIHWYQEDYQDQASRRLNKGQILHQAVQLKNFEVHAQPRLNCRTGEILALECLVRLPLADGELLYPEGFIELAEQNGMIRDIDHYMLEQALSLVNDWLQQGIEPLPLAVNLSIQSINEKLLELFAKWQVRNSGVFRYIEVELSEQQLPEDDKEVLDCLHSLREFDVALTLDDFGTGYSSLARLPEWPFQILKMDRSFIVDLPTSEQQQAVVKSVIDLCATLKIEVVAEGIETEAELTMVNDLGCSCIQGFVYAKPKIITDIQDWVISKKLTEQ